MKKSIIGFIMTMVFVAISISEAAFANKIAKVVVGYGESRSTLANFPVLVRIPAGTAAECRADGADIRFTSPDGETEYPHEIDAWNPDGESTVWVLCPKCSTARRSSWNGATRTTPAPKRPGRRARSGTQPDTPASGT